MQETKGQVENEMLSVPSRVHYLLPVLRSEESFAVLSITDQGNTVVLVEELMDRAAVIYCIQRTRTGIVSTASVPRIQTEPKDWEVM